MKYHAKLTREGRYWNADVVDCPGCFTFGDSREHAMEMAAEALTGWLESTLARGHVPPVPKYTKGRPVEVDGGLMVSVLVRILRVSQGLSQTALAQAAGVTQQQVSRLESPGANPTMRTLMAVAKALKSELVVQELAA